MARCAREIPDKEATSVFHLLRQRPLLIFAGGVLLFQLANAAMLPLMAGVVTTRSSQWAPVLIAACIIVPQAIVALTSPSVGRKAQAWGRRPLLLLAFAALAIRGLLFAVVSDPYLLVAVQVFDGITAAVLSVMVPLIVADVAFGSGHFNLAQGIVGTATGIGASLSTVLAGYISDTFGSSTAFTGLAAIAALGLDGDLAVHAGDAAAAGSGGVSASRDDGRRDRLAIQRAVAGGRQIPAEGSRHRAAPHGVEAVLGAEGSNARLTPPRKDSADGCGNRKPVSPSLMVSASPPVWWPIGSDPNRCAYIWLSPHGSNRDGISVKSLPAKIRRACASLKPMVTPIASGLRRCASTSACSIWGSPLPVTTICPPASMISSAADSTRSMPFW